MTIVGDIKPYVMEDPTSHRSPPTALFIPHWLKPMMALNKLTMDDIVKYRALIEHMGIEDRARLIAFNRLFEKLMPLYFHHQNTIFKNDTELETYLSTAPNSDTFFDFAINQDASVDVSTLTPQYEIKHFNEEVFLIYVENNFAHTLWYRDRFLAFISDCLRAQFAYTKYSLVHRSVLYRTYLDLINSKIPFSSIFSVKPNQGA